MNRSDYELFVRRELALTLAEERAKDPEFKALWKQKRIELERNYKVKTLEDLGKNVQTTVNSRITRRNSASI